MSDKKIYLFNENNKPKQVYKKIVDLLNEFKNFCNKYDIDDYRKLRNALKLVNSLYNKNVIENLRKYTLF